MVTALAIARGAMLRSAAGEHCAALLPLGEVRAELRAVDPGAGTGRVLVLDPGCRGAVTARWPDASTVPAGARLVVEARWRPRIAPLGRPDGTLSIRRIVRVVPGGGPVAASRTAVAATIRTRFGPRAPIVEALLTGRRGELDRDLQDAFAASGLVHLLAISGFHVGVLIGWVVLVATALGLPRRRSVALAAVLALGYAAWLGWPPPATRAAVLAALLVLMHRRQRSVPLGALLGASAMVVLTVDPWALSRIGAWMSFAAIAGVGRAVAWARWATPRLPLLRDAVAASWGATLATAPFAALVIGRVALVGPLLTPLALPLVAGLVPAAAVAVLLDPLLPGVAAAFAASAAWMIDLLSAIATRGADLPGAARTATAGVAQALPWLVALIAAVFATARRTSPAEAVRRAGWGGAALLWIQLVPTGGGVAGPAGRLTLHFLDVGQGDAIAIQTPKGRWVLVDAGPADGRWDAGARVVVPRLRRLGADRLDALVVSHPHRDHVGGAAAVLAALPVGLIVGPGTPFREQGYLAMLRGAQGRGIRWRPVSAGERWQLDGVQFRVVHPPPDWQGGEGDLNEESVVLDVRFGAFTALLTGDAGIVAESEFVAHLAEVDLLKVGHHGSRWATGAALLEASVPVAAVVSSGRNRYGHPSPEALARLAAVGTAVWRTDRDGQVSVETDGRSFTVRGGRHVATFDAGELNHGDTACCMQPR